MIIKHSKLFKIYYLKNCGWDVIVEGTQTSGGAHIQSVFISLSRPHYCIRHCQEMSLDSSRPSPRCAKPTRHLGRAHPLQAKKPRHQTPRHQGITEEEAFIMTEQMGSYPWNGRI